MRWLQSTSEPKYAVLENSRSASDEQSRHASSRIKWSLAILSSFTTVGLIAVFFLVAKVDLVSPVSNFCTDPPIRREWRSLTAKERDDFVQAIKCIAGTQSFWKPNRTIYDDIAILHGGVGNLCESTSRTKS